MSSLHEPAPPLLGSTLLANEEKLESSRSRPPLSSGLDTIDREALGGGFRYGEITAVAGANGTGKTLLAYQIIASHLIACKEGEVALIATTDPPLARLRDILLNRLNRQKRGTEFCQSGYVYRKDAQAGGPSQDIQTQVNAMLQRVRLSRVFDFPGVVEAIGEFSARLDDEEVHQRDRATRDRDVSEKARSVANSEDKAESSSRSLNKNDEAIERKTSANSEVSEHLPASLVVIDHIANLAGPMMTKSKVQGQAMLATFMRSLQYLTRRSNLCTVIVNAAVGLRRQSAQYPCGPDDQVSVFSSVLGKPALGKHFSYLIDTSILLSTLPQSKKDANGFTTVGVIEVLKDRNGSREGRWSSFVTAAGTELHSLP
ncbi:MAG: hypothetical protein Q9168_001675 [Polycauliona sp. 1 TL-2023]